MIAIERLPKLHDRDVRRVTSSAGITVSYHTYGDGPPLVLVHGGFNSHETNWAFVAPILAKVFTIYAVARRGRGQTDATEGHSIEDEGRDLAALLEEIDGPAFLLGHSYGAHVVLAAATEVPDRARALVLYEPPWPRILRRDVQISLETLARNGDWEAFAVTFFRDVLAVPDEELNELRTSKLWPSIVANGRSMPGDMHALSRYTFDAERFRRLHMPVTLQIGTESRRDFFVTDALADVLPNVRVEILPGQAHDAMVTAPEQYAGAVSHVLPFQEHFRSGQNDRVPYGRSDEDARAIRYRCWS